MVCVICGGGRGGGGGRAAGGGRGGRGRRGGRGWEGGRGGEPTNSPNPLEEAKLHRRPGAHLWVHTEGPPPPPPHTTATSRGSEEGIKRWGIEGIRIGTSDRFGRGRGEYRILINCQYYSFGLHLITLT